MTRDDHRAQCIEAMARALKQGFLAGDNYWKQQAIAAFDSLHDIANVVPIEATEEMIDEGADMMAGLVSEGREGRAAVKIFDAMSAAGRLTNPPEEKP